MARFGGPRRDFKIKSIAQKGEREDKKEGEGRELTAAKNERRKFGYLRKN